MVDAALYPEVIAQMNGKQSDNAEADALRDLIPVYSRIQVPLDSKSSLKECAALLRTLAEEMRILADRNDISQTQALYRAWGLVKSTNSRLQDSTRYSNQK